MTRERLKTSRQMLQRMWTRGGQALRAITCGRRVRERRVAVNFEAVQVAVVPVTVLG